MNIIIKTKQDIEHLIADGHGSEAAAYLQRLIDSRQIWQIDTSAGTNGVLESADSGTTDETHEVRAVEEKTIDANTGEETTTTIYVQYMFSDDANCALFRLGYTVAGAEEIITGINTEE